MNQRSKIRQSALHYIYAKQQGGASDCSDELFWQISLEKDRDHYRRCLGKMIVHNGRNSQDSFRLLEERCATMIEACENDLTTSSLRDELVRFMSHSTKLENALIALGYALVDKRSDDSEALQAACDEVLAIAGILKELAPDLIHMFADYPLYHKYSEGLKAVIKRRATISERLVILRDPELLSAEGEYKALVHATNELAVIRPAAQELALQVLSQQERWEEIIEPLLNNYSIERLDLLDKCILVLMLYELKVLELPLPVVVSEATSLANAYSGSKSASFIHGVLAASHKVESAS